MDRQFWKGAAVGGAAVVIAMAGRFVSIYGVDTVLTNREYAEKLRTLEKIIDTNYLEEKDKDAIPLVGLIFVYNSTVQYIITKFNLLTEIVDYIPVMEIYRTLLPIGLAVGVGIGRVVSFLTTRKQLKL